MKVDVTAIIHDEYFTIDVPEELWGEELEDFIREEVEKQLKERELSIQLDY